MNLLDDMEYAIKVETTELSSLYLDLLQPQERETPVKSKPKKVKKHGKGKYHWSRVEQKRYIDFLLENLTYFSMSAVDRRMMGINSRMGKAIKSRDTNQCRSHHQKMLSKFGSVEKVVEQFQHLLCPRNLKKWNQLCLNGQEWKILEESVCSSNQSIQSFEREKYRQKMSQLEAVHFFDSDQHSILEEGSFHIEDLF